MEKSSFSCCCSRKDWSDTKTQQSGKKRFDILRWFEELGFGAWCKKYHVSRSDVNDGQASVFRASGGHEPSVFLDFRLRAGSGKGKICFGRAGGRVLMYFQVPNLGIEPVRRYNFFGFRSSGGLG